MTRGRALAERLARLQPTVRLAKLGTVNTLGVGWTDSRRGSRHARGYGSEWDRLRVQILKRDNYLCQCQDCRALGRIKPASEVDHIVNKAQGGTDDPSNLQAINPDCHRVKSAREAAAGRGLRTMPVPGGGGGEAKTDPYRGPTAAAFAGFFSGPGNGPDA